MLGRPFLWYHMGVEGGNVDKWNGGRKERNRIHEMAAWDVCSIKQVRKSRYRMNGMI